MRRASRRGRSTGPPAAGPTVAVSGGMTKPTKSIVVATDFSEGSDEALEHAIELGKQSGAALDLLHVVEPPADGFPFGPAYTDGVAFAEFIQQELTRRAARVAAAGLACHTRFVEGSAAPEIVARAREVDARLIVVGTHGRRGLAHVLLGSVAERVVQHAGCPVLTVPFSAARKAA
jgi:nucleotide-binding universal stress UspA family protein